MVIHRGVGWVQELTGMEEVAERLPESAENRSLRERCLEGGMAFGRRTQPLPDPRRAGTEGPRGRNDTSDSLPPPSLFCPAPVGEIQQEQRTKEPGTLSTASQSTGRAKEGRGPRENFQPEVAGGRWEAPGAFCSPALFCPYSQHSCQCTNEPSLLKGRHRKTVPETV